MDYIEEPLAEPAALNRLSAQSGVPCAVDETLQELSACLFAADENAHLAKEAALRHIVEGAQALIWKPSLCMPPERMALQTDAPVILSSAYESGVGTAAILKMATTPRFRNSATGIDTYSRFADDVLDQRLPVFRGEADMRAVADTSHALNPAKLTQVWHV